MDPKFSPDGSKILFNGSNIGGGHVQDIYTVPSSGGALTQLTNDENVYRHEWSPDGMKIVYVGPGDEIWVMSHTGNNKVNLNVVGDHPVWIPNP